MSSCQIPTHQEPQIAGFVSKTYDILNNEEFNKIIYWGVSGKQFVIKDTNKFQQIVLPKFFRHKKINSFIRQLNMYGFHKSRRQNTKSIFRHPFFVKGREDLLKQIKRKVKPNDGQPITPSKNDNQDIKKEILTPSTNKDNPQTKNGINSYQEMSLRQLFESRPNIPSRINFGNLGSLNKFSQPQIGNIKLECQDNDDDLLSIQQQIKENNKKKLEKQLEKINFENPSYFFLPPKDEDGLH